MGAQRDEDRQIRIEWIPQEVERGRRLSDKKERGQEEERGKEDSKV